MPHGATPDISLDKARLRALAHPVRLTVLAVLRQRGPATASGIARALDIHPGAASYHLRQLAAHGFVVDVPGQGTTRERWWRSAYDQVIHDPATTPPENRAAGTAYTQAVALAAADRLRAAATDLPLVPREWAEASVFSDALVRLNPADAVRMKDELLAVIARYRATDSDTDSDTDSGPDPMVVQLQMFPAPGRQPAP